VLERNSLRSEFNTGKFQNNSMLSKLPIRGIEIQLKPSKQNNENQNKMISTSNDSLFESIAINLIAEAKMRRGYPQSGFSEQ